MSIGLHYTYYSIDTGSESTFIKDFSGVIGNHSAIMAAL